MYGVDTSELERLKEQRFLIVDDEVVNIEFFIRFFEDLELNFDVAYDGQQAVDLIFSHPPDYFSAVLMDIRMPQLNGTAATEKVKQRAEWADLPIIAVSGNHQPQDYEYYLKSGMVDLLPKPADLRSIIAMLIKWSITTPAPPEQTAVQHNPVDQEQSASSIAGGSGGPLTDVDMDRRLQETGISPSGYRRLLQAFLFSQQGAIEDIHRALNDQNLSTVADVAHKLAGACGNIGADRLKEMFKQLQHQCESEGVAAVDPEIVQVIEAKLSMLCSEIDLFCKECV